MNYILNEQKFFADSIEGQAVLINTDTFVYYVFNQYASAVMEDLRNGCSYETVLAALKKVTDDGQIEKKFSGFIKELIDEKILLESAGGAEDTAASATAKLQKSDFPEFTLDKYSDVSEYFAADPIHEVNPDKGWNLPGN